MEYYEFEYDNLWQKILWGVEIISVGSLLPLLTVSFIKFLSTAVCIALFILSILGGIALSICNMKKLRGVFVFDDCIEIVGYYLKSKEIKYEDINDLRICEKYSYYYYTVFGMSNGGGRRNCLIIDAGLSHYHIKVKNQEELIKNIISKCDKEFDI